MPDHSLVELALVGGLRPERPHRAGSTVEVSTRARTQSIGVTSGPWGQLCGLSGCMVPRKCANFGGANFAAGGALGGASAMRATLRAAPPPPERYAGRGEHR